MKQMKKILTLTTIILITLLGTFSNVLAQVEFSPDTLIKPSKANLFRLSINGGAIRIVPKTGNTILLNSGTITSINGLTTPSVTLTTSNIAEGSNLYYNSTRVQGVGDARYPQLGLTYTDPTWITSLSFSKLSAKPTTIAGYGITDALNTSGSYSNPSWITSLAFSKLSGTPTTVSGYGIIDAVSTSITYSNPSWLSTLAFSKISGTPTTAVGYGITDVYTKAQVLPFSTVATYAAAQALGVSGLQFVVVTTDEQYGETNSLYIKINSALYKVVRNVE